MKEDANSFASKYGTDKLRRLADDVPPDNPADYGPPDDKERCDEPPPLRSIRFTPFADIQLGTAPRYLVRGLLPDVGLVVVWGRPKCGKSFFIFDLVAHIAAGWQYQGRRVIQRPVIYFALEGQRGFEARVVAFRQEFNVTDIKLYLSGDRIVLPTDGAAVVQSIRQQFPEISPGVVVLDTLNRSIEGGENNDQDMSNYVKAADMIREAFNCIVIVIHHCNADGNKPRGHTALTGAADAQIVVKRDAAKNVVAKIEFMKDGAEGDEIISRLVPKIVGKNDLGEDESSCIVEPADAIKSKPELKGQSEIAFNILCELLADEGKVPPHNAEIPPATRTLSEKRWRSACYSKMFSEDTTQTSKQKAFVRAAKDLQNKKRIGKYEDHVWMA
jgi:hypothetical protein